MPKILVSACLFGENVRYDGRHSLIDHPEFRTWQDQGWLLPHCPEVAGGLPVPRVPCEIDQSTGRVLDETGNDHTKAFEEGAQKALELVQRYDIRFALLKERSPSCGSTQIYDGSFGAQKMSGQGITARLLKDHGVKVFNEEEIQELKAALEEQYLP